jgi:hypothetical protein
MYITPLTTSRRSTRRLPPPRLPGGIRGPICAHSSSVGNDGLVGLHPSQNVRPDNAAWLDRTGLSAGLNLAAAADCIESLLAVRNRPREPGRNILAEESFGAFERWFATVRGPSQAVRYRLGELAYFIRRFLR